MFHVKVRTSKNIRHDSDVTPYFHCCVFPGISYARRFLGVMAMIFTYIFAFSMGIYAGKNPHTKMDHFIGGVNYFLLAIPSYIAGVFAIYFFSFKLGWVPFSGSVDISVDTGTLDSWLSLFYHALMP